jgi:SAM-dependent methyltransferase
MPHRPRPHDVGHAPRDTDRTRFETLITALADAGSVPIAVAPVGPFLKLLNAPARDPRGHVVCVIDEGETRVGKRFAGLDVRSLDDAISLGVKAVIITAPGELQDEVWEHRRRFRDAGLEVYCVPDRFHPRPWDDMLADFYRFKQARDRGIDTVYTQLYPPPSHNLPEKTAALFRDRFNAGETVLEIGAGYGLVTEFLIDAAGHYHIADFSERLLFEVLEHRFAHRLDKLTLHHDTTAELPGISGATVDFAFAFDVFVHTGPELLHQYIRTMSRVLKPDGRALLHYLPWNPDTLGDWERVWQHSHRGKHSGMYYNSLESIRVSATSCGLVASHIDHTMKWSGELVELTRK